MIRKVRTPLLLVTLIIATAFLSGCKEEVFLTVFAEPLTIVPNETSSITAIVTAGKNVTIAKPVKDATVRIWIPQTEKAFAKLSSTTVTTDKHGSAVVKLTALDISIDKTIHVTAKVKDQASKCIVIIKKR